MIPSAAQSESLKLDVAMRSSPALGEVLERPSNYGINNHLGHEGAW
jgi:hypothetical protein